MKVFATRVWGYTPEGWPIAGFGSEGICSNLIRNSSAGDLLVYVGTKGSPTLPEHQGNILGILEFGREIVDTLTIVDKDMIRPEHYDDRGEFRWPRGIIMSRAWRIDMAVLPDLVETIGRQLPYNATTMAVELSDDEAKAVLELPCHEVTLKGSAFFTRLQRKLKNLTKGGRSNAPIPSDRVGGAYTTGQESYTYVMRFGKTRCFKVGRTIDIERRLGELNAHVPFEILDKKWGHFLTELHENENRAHEMEQALLDQVPQRSIHGERFLMDDTDLSVLWAKCLMGLKGK